MTPEEIETVLADIALERPSRRQLRRAAKITEAHGINAESDLDAVRLLREAGIDPFSLSSMVRHGSFKGKSDASTANITTTRASESELVPLPGDNIRQRKKPTRVGRQSTDQTAEVNQAAEILRMQRQIAKSRQRKLALLSLRMLGFVLLPTLVAGWYFYMVATPIYSVRSEFMIFQSEPNASSGSLSGSSRAQLVPNRRTLRRLKVISTRAKQWND